MITAMRDTLVNLYRRMHVADIAAPRDWNDQAEVARWLLALCLRRDGRADALIAADALVPERARHEPGLRERTAIALAMWEAWAALDWSKETIALAFGVPLHDVKAQLGFVAAELRAGVGRQCRQGMADVRRVVRAAVDARAA